MSKDKIVLYVIESFLIISCLCFVFFSNIFTKTIIAIILVIFMIITNRLVKSNKSKARYNKKLTIIMMIIAIFYIIALYVLGIYVGFYNATVKFSQWTIFNYIIPYIIIIISIENIRKTILLKDDKKSNIILLLVCIILDIAISTNLQAIKTLMDYFMLIGFIVFSSIANNVLFNYIIKNFRNCKAIIIYRMITILYVYFIPIVPNLNILFECIIRMIIPYIIYLILEANYGKKEKEISTRKKTTDILITSILIILAVCILMLVSCKFKYGALVIGSGSMSGTINKGDVIIYETLDDKVEVGDIIVFKSEDVRIIHRVIRERNSNDGTVYYTKGDANQNEDEGYRMKQDIIGKVKFRIPYIGQLTVFINEIFN